LTRRVSLLCFSVSLFSIRNLEFVKQQISTIYPLDMWRQSIKVFDICIKKTELMFRYAMKKLQLATFGIRMNQSTRIHSWSRARKKSVCCLSRLLRANQCYFAGNSLDVTLEFANGKFPSLFPPSVSTRIIFHGDCFLVAQIRSSIRRYPIG